MDEFKTPWLQLAGGRDPHKGAQALWKVLVGGSVPGYSAVRWYAWAEITFVIAEAGMRVLRNFIETCEDRDYGDESTKKLRSIYDNKSDKLRLELAAMLDVLIDLAHEVHHAHAVILFVTRTTAAAGGLGFPRDVLVLLAERIRATVAVDPGVATAALFCH